MMAADSDLFKGRHFDQQVIMLCVRWYLSYKLSSRDLVNIMDERGIVLAHTTILRWVQRYVPEFEKRWGRYARSVGGSWRCDETYILVGGKWMVGGVSFGETLAGALGIPFVLGVAEGISRARYYPDFKKIRVKLLAEPGTLKLIGAQLVGGEGIKERCDFLAMAARKGPPEYRSRACPAATHMPRARSQAAARAESRAAICPSTCRGAWSAASG